MTRLLVLSPHRDDAVFSLAMALCYWRERQVTTCVANFFTQSGYGPYANGRNKSGDALTAEISQQREREDRRALSAVDPQIRIRSTGWLDAPLRLNISAAEVCSGDQKSVRGSDVAVLSRELGKVRASAVIAPLGLGNHVDHLTVRAAAMKAVRGSALAFYEDLPYATWTSEAAILERVSDTERQTRTRLVSMAIRGSCSVRLKRRFANRYRTQIEPFEAKSIAAYAYRYRSGERIWIPKHSRLWRSLVQ